jgi:hypothetical protein
MTCATRGSVHRSVANPCLRAPCRRAQSTWRSCSAFSLGSRPARPAPFSAAMPPLLHCLYHRVTLCRLTCSARAIPASAPRPSAFPNSRAACARRCFSPSKSRLCPIPAVPMQRNLAQLIDLSTYYARFSKLDHPYGAVKKTSFVLANVCAVQAGSVGALVLARTPPQRAHRKTWTDSSPSARPTWKACASPRSTGTGRRAASPKVRVSPQLSQIRSTTSGDPFLSLLSRGPFSPVFSLSVSKPSSSRISLAMSCRKEVQPGVDRGARLDGERLSPRFPRLAPPFDHQEPRSPSRAKTGRFQGPSVEGLTEPPRFQLLENGGGGN